MDQKATSGIAPDEVLDKGSAIAIAIPSDWSRDGRYIIETRNEKGLETWVLPLFGDRKPLAYLQADFNQWNAKLSPNGQWLAYVSDESKRTEVYVQTFPTRWGKWQVSQSGATGPVWSRDGKELFLIGADRKLMAVEVKGNSRFEAGKPKPLFETRLGGRVQAFDVSKDGLFLMPALIEPTGTESMTVVVNWAAGLKK